MYRILIVTWLFALSGCIDPIPESEFSRDEPDYVNVYGLLDDEGNSTVWLSRSIDFFDGDRVPAPIRDADVILSDENGGFYPYREIEDGAKSRYELVGFQPKINTGYALTVQLPEGDTLRSTLQYLRPGAEIIDTRLEYVAGRSINSLGNEVDNRYWNVHVSHKDSSGREGFFTWRWRGTYRFQTEPGPIIFCYSNEYDNVFRVSSRDERASSESLVAQIEVETKKLEFTYQLDISQYYFDDPAIYNYWELIGIQQTSAGSIFDPLPSPITGNITAVNNQELIVKGIFWAATRQQTRLHIDRGDFPGVLTDFFTDRPCWMFPFTSEEQPEYYPNFDEIGG